MNTLSKIQAAAKAGQLFASTQENLATWLKGDLPAWALASIEELVAREAWAELNDRFYRYLEFGTGGMRGRTIGAVTTAPETDGSSEQGTPAHAAVGSNMLNDFTLVRATMGLYRYTQRFLEKAGRFDAPKLVIAHDVRHFSRHFCELAASTWTRLGGVAFIFDGPRSTPQLSFTVRYLKAHAGVVITASHNPPHDNGFKAYFEDGGQVVPPHDKGVVGQVNAIPLSELKAYLDKELGRVITLSRAADDAYLSVASKAALDLGVFQKTRLKVAYSNIHGTGGIASVPLLLHAGAEVHEVSQQVAFDPRFPTVKSPNPENAEALSKAVALADSKGLDVVLATDPDCDRMGCAVRNRDGRMELLTGNQIGAMLAEYRISKYKELGWIPKKGGDSVVLVKTFVTSPLQDAVARGHGIKVVNTLTGFKWIGAKLRAYEEQLKARMLSEQGIALDYDATPFETRAKLLQKYSSFYVFGGEESYGYLGNDYVRDKDGNAACLMFAELCASVKSRGLTVPDYLDEIYLKYGFFLEGVINLYYEGATGAAKIKSILDTYRSEPPKAFGETAVTKFQDFGREKVIDADGDVIPSQDLYFVTLANGYSFAARGSGTEPKMKFYLFAQSKVDDAKQLAKVKTDTKANLDALKALIEADAKQRAER
ncbi:phospho-sugar mutase [Opitutaceae bacterium EW11]|nr:phospho-sugar mutase [Opitutaceae bacterium EW11]